MSINAPDNSVPLLYGSSTPGSHSLVHRSLGRAPGKSKPADSKSGGGSKDDSKDKKVESKNMLGTFDGVFVPCILNILGVILFLKLGWGLGTAGVVGMLIIFAIAELLCILTVLSLSAILTNGTMEGGGAYYMISRSLGPEFGGAIGVLFYIANAFGASFYFIGFAEGIALFDFVRVIICEDDVDDDTFCFTTINFNRIFGVVSLILCFVVSWVGADAFTRVNIPLFILQLLTVGIGAASYLVPVDKNLNTTTVIVPSCQTNLTANPTTCEYTTTNLTFPNVVVGLDNVTGNYFHLNWAMPAAGTAKPWPYPNEQNLAACPATSSTNHENIYQPCDLLQVFSIIFPAVTGIMVGSNLSGDLRDPATAIPGGTFWAMFASFLMYVLLIFTMAFSFSPDTLMYNGAFWQEASWLGGIPIVVGVMVASLSSGLGALFGGSRILQAMARDDLFPKWLQFINVFGYGSKKGDEPHYALLLTAAISLIGVAIANLDSIANMITSFYLLTYSIVNWTCFFLAITGAPNFRPTWKYFTWHTALLGGIMNLVVLFLTSWVFGLISIVLMIAIVILLQFSGKTKDWGDVSQALVYHQVRKFLLILDSSEKSHSKFWRPSFLVLVDDMYRPYSLLGTLESLKKGGLLVLGAVVDGELPRMAPIREEVRKAWLEVIRKCALKAFVQVGVSEDVRSAYRLLITCAGLGGLDTNTVVLPLPSNMNAGHNGTQSPNRAPRSESYYTKVSEQLVELEDATPRSADVNIQLRAPAIATAQDWLGIVRDTLSLKRNVLIECGFESMPLDATLPQNKRYKRGPSSSEQLTFVDAWLNFDSLVFNNGGSAVSILDAVLPKLRGEAESEKASLNELAVSESQLHVRTSRSVTKASVTEGYDYDTASETDATETKSDAGDDDTEDGPNVLSFQDSSSLLLQLAFILVKSRKWAKHAQLRVNVLYRNESDGEFTNDVLEEAIEEHVREFCLSIRVNVNVFRIINIDASTSDEGSSAPTMLVNRCRRVVKSYSDKTMLALLPLPSFEHVATHDAATAASYCDSLHSLTEDLGPLFLVKFGEGTDIVTDAL